MINSKIISIVSIITISILSFDITSAKIITKIGAPKEIQEKVQYAYDISGGNMKFIGTIDAENSSWNVWTKSGIGYYRKGKKYYDYGICQISEYYHPKIVNNIEFFTSWKYQIDSCWKLYKGGTKFYGSKNASKKILNFKVK